MCIRVKFHSLAHSSTSLLLHTQAHTRTHTQTFCYCCTHNTGTLTYLVTACYCYTYHRHTYTNTFLLLHTQHRHTHTHLRNMNYTLLCETQQYKLDNITIGSLQLCLFCKYSTQIKPATICPAPPLDCRQRYKSRDKSQDALEIMR